MWVRAYSQSGKALPLASGPDWWKRYGVHNVTYSFAFGNITNIWLVVDFQQFRKRGQATFYASGPKHPALEVMTLAHHLAVRHALPTIRLVSRGGGWIVHNKTDYNLVETVWPGHNRSTPKSDQSVASRITIGGHQGVPQWEVSHALGRQYQSKTVHGFGFPVFGVTARMAGSPPFRVQSSLIPLFPYFSIGYLPGDGIANANWFTINPSPIFFNVLGYALEQFPYVGFEYAGIYDINSYSPPPHVDFESPFVFYGYQPGRLADMIFREENFPPGDTGGLPPTNIQRTLFRVSWKTTNPQVWDYSLQLAGFYQDRHLVKIGPAQFYGLNSRTLPSTVLNRKWPLVTFVQLGNGYPGSEGNYFYGGSGSPTLWTWLGGLSSTPTPYLSHPFLLPNDALTDSSHRGLPVGFRGEYSNDYFRKPELYVSPVDRLVHLLNAQGGIQNLGHRLILRTTAIGGSPYQNVWMLQRISGRLQSYHWKGHTLDSLYDLNPFLLSITPATVTLSRPNQSLSNRLLPVPQGKAAWSAFARTVASYQTGRPPLTLSSWVDDFKGPIVHFPHAHVINVTLSSTHIALWMHLARAVNAAAVLGASATHLKKGLYQLQYTMKTHAWNISRATPAHVRLISRTLSAPRLFALQTARLVLANEGTVPWAGVIQLKENGRVVGVHQVTLSGHIRHSVVLHWVPHRLGRQVLSITANHHTLKRQMIKVIRVRRPLLLDLSPADPGHFVEVAVILGLMLWAVGYTWRRISWTQQ
ncbi:MAG: hypothetical protein C7B45_01320 [Sulfobacillus acidophilus]|uniref:Uncharacterized protein n=1 Tax=Sulfobacillus acidophilus TaxID=53633 RepID=A0A2T2WP20_9FIRM|nr:MAG: hypothetical protein C7B45_01320 [Sulfobacillus acidophilus]